MTVHILPAALAILVGLVASGAVDATTSGGSTTAVPWAAFAISLVIVARDTMLGGSFLPEPGRLPRLPVEVREGDVRVRFWSFEPVATTVAIMLGLLASQAVDFRAGGNDPAGGVTGVVWAAFALSLFMALGGRLAPRPRRRRKSREEWERRGEEIGRTIEARVEEVVEEIQRRFGSGPRSSD